MNVFKFRLVVLYRRNEIALYQRHTRTGFEIGVASTDVPVSQRDRQHEHARDHRRGLPARAALRSFRQTVIRRWQVTQFIRKLHRRDQSQPLQP